MGFGNSTIGIKQEFDYFSVDLLYIYKLFLQI